MKKKLFTFIYFTFFIGVISTLAQVPPAYKAGYEAVLRQAGSASFEAFQRMNSAHMFRHGKVSETEFYFKIKLKDKSIKEVHSNIYFDTLSNKTYVIYVNKSLPKKDSTRNQKIYCNETTSVLGSTLPIDEIIRANITDSCWLFQTQQGTINVYSFYPVSKRNAAIAAIQYGDGPIEPFDADKLKKRVEDNVFSVEAMNKNNYLEAIKIYNDAAKR